MVNVKCNWVNCVDFTKFSYSNYSNYRNSVNSFWKISNVEDKRIERFYWAVSQRTRIASLVIFDIIIVIFKLGIYNTLQFPGCWFDMASKYWFFFWKILEDVCPFCGTTDTPVLDLWWRLPWVSKPGWMFSHLCDPDLDSPLVQYLLIVEVSMAAESYWISLGLR